MGTYVSRIVASTSSSASACADPAPRRMRARLPSARRSAPRCLRPARADRESARDATRVCALSASGRSSVRVATALSRSMRCRLVGHGRSLHFGRAVEGVQALACVGAGEGEREEAAPSSRPASSGEENACATASRARRMAREGRRRRAARAAPALERLGRDDTRADAVLGPACAQRAPADDLEASERLATRGSHCVPPAPGMSPLVSGSPEARSRRQHDVAGGATAAAEAPAVTPR
jgi:hypothetical protein